MFCVPTAFPFKGRQPTARKFSEFARYYEVDWSNVLGKGGFSTVYRGKDKTTGRTVAIKKIPRQLNSKSGQGGGSSNKVLKQEINAAMKVKNHEYIVKLHDVFVAADVVILCMEYMEGDVLFKHIVHHGPLPEKVAQRQFYNLAKALHHLHTSNIVHRDLKPENLMFVKSSQGSSAKGVPVEENVLKITDFGLSKTLPDNARMMQTFCGTPAYLAPEAWAAQYEGQEYDRKVDTWAFGVTLFVAISGYHPFDPTGSADLKILRDNVLSFRWGFEDPGWNSITAPCKDLISKLICCVRTRFTADEIVNHPWFRDLRLEDERNLKFANNLQVSGKKRTMRRSLSERIRALSLNGNNSSGNVSTFGLKGLSRRSFRKKSSSSNTETSTTNQVGKKARVEMGTQESENLSGSLKTRKPSDLEVS